MSSLKLDGYGDGIEVFYRSTVLKVIDREREDYRAERRRASGYDQVEDAFYSGAEQALRVLRNLFAEAQP